MWPAVGGVGVGALIDFGKTRRKVWMPFRGGHGRTPNATDPRQGKARGETYRAQTKWGILSALIAVLIVVAVFMAGVLLFDPGLRPWGLTLVALAVVVTAAWRWRKRAAAVSIKDTLTDLTDD